MFTNLAFLALLPVLSPPRQERTWLDQVAGQTVTVEIADSTYPRSVVVPRGTTVVFKGQADARLLHALGVAGFQLIELPRNPHV